MKNNRKIKIRNVLWILGIIFVVSGTISTIAAFVNLLGSNEPYLHLFFIGSPLLIAGGFCLIISQTGSLGRYLAGKEKNKKN